MKKRILLTTLSSMLVVLSVFNNGWAQSNNRNNANKQNQITLNLQDVDIRVLINTVAEVSGKNFVVDPRVKGKVSVVSGSSLEPDQLYDVFLSILEVHNFATVDSGSLVKVLPSNVIKQRPTPTAFSPTKETNDSQITQIIQLEYASVQDMVPIVRPLIPPTSHFAPHVPSNSIILTDTAANIQRVLEIIKRIDVPDKRSNVRVVYLDKAKASDLANTLTQLVANNASGDPKAAGGRGRAGKVSIQPLNAINALIINAPDDEYAKIQALVDELDIERELESDVNVIYLKHAKAPDLVTILNDITASATEGAVSQFSVQADEATNSLIVKASGNQLKTVKSVVQKLDLRRAQVFVETVIAEVSLTQAAALGVTWGAGGGTSTSSGGTPADGDTPAVPGTTTTTGNIVNSRNPSQVLGTAAVGSAFELGNTGFNYSLLDFKKYQLDVIVNAIRSDSNSNILSTPTLLTLDNEEAEIVVGQEVPFITGRFNSTNNSDGTSNNNNNNNFQQIERKDVGIKLKVKPQISDGDAIQLEVSQEISSVSTTSIQGQADLITNRRSIDAVVQVDDGQVVVLGGLITEDVDDVVSWVPVLGKIPLIGVLFRNKSKNTIKRNLMVFLKPRIIRSPEALAEYSKTKYDSLRLDSKLSEKNSSKFLIEGAVTPVLKEYDEVINEGEFQTERREGLSQEKRRKGWFSNKQSVQSMEDEIMNSQPNAEEVEPLIDNALEGAK